MSYEGLEHNGSQQQRLSWQRFRDGALRRGSSPPQATTLDDCLVCTTNHFFVIVGTGAFVPGYLIIITKTPYTSLAAIPNAYTEELTWLMDAMSNLVAHQYGKNVVCFEHGMCGCSGAENAHLHLMPVSKQATVADFQTAVNQVLDHRGIGVTDAIDRELQRNLRSEDSNREVWTFEQLPQGALETYPKPNNHQPGKYVYFKAPFSDASFLTYADLGSQVGREIVFEVEKRYDKLLRKLATNSLTCSGQLPWRWQDFDFSDNILQTMKDVAEPLTHIQASGAGETFDFRSHLVPTNVKHAFRHVAHFNPAYLLS